MTNPDFWETWGNPSAIEQRAINSVKKARDQVINAIPKEALVAIYIKGSFTRREMNEQSDVDMVPIVTEDKYEGSVFELNEPEIAPVMVIPLSLEEFRKNELSAPSDQSIDLRAKPDRFLRFLKDHKLIYGTPLNPEDYPIRSDAEALKDEIKILNEGYIPLYLRKEIGFDPLLKEIFWTIELELLSKGVSVEHSFRGISEAAPADHPINQAMRLREDTHTVENEMEFVTRIQNWILKSEKSVV